MADYLIDSKTQERIASAIDKAVQLVLAELPNHGGEEGLTPVLGHALMQQSFSVDDLKVQFNYRQLSKYTEEPVAGADGGILVRVTAPGQTVKKAALFQAKLLKGSAPTRELTIKTEDATRLRDQCRDMLSQSTESVAIFYTKKDIYVVDAARYKSTVANTPLSRPHRLITLGTYLGKWMPRCTRGDDFGPFIDRVERPEGFREGLQLDVITSKVPISWINPKAKGRI